MRDLLRALRGLALVAVALSVIALPIAGVLLFTTFVLGVGDDGFGDIIAVGIAIFLLIMGGSGLVLGGGIAVLAKRAIAGQVAVAGPLRGLLIGGLAIAVGELVLAALLASETPQGVGFGLLIGLSAIFGSGYVVVAATSAGRGERIVATAVALALLVLGGSLVVVLAQPSLFPTLAN